MMMNDADEDNEDVVMKRMMGDMLMMVSRIIRVQQVYKHLETEPLSTHMVRRAPSNT